MGRNWVRTSDIALPVQGVVVETMDSGGNMQTLVYKDGHWFLPDYSMYVYFVPRYWRYLDDA
jgi:hypothetical protein